MGECYARAVAAASTTTPRTRFPTPSQQLVGCHDRTATLPQNTVPSVSVTASTSTHAGAASTTMQLGTQDDTTSRSTQSVGSVQYILMFNFYTYISFYNSIYTSNVLIYIYSHCNCTSFSYILNFASPYIPVLYCVLVPTACVHIIHTVNFHPATIFLLHGSISIIERITCFHACRLNITYNIITLYLNVFILLRLMSTTYILAITCLSTTSIVHFATLLLFFFTD